MKRVEKITKYGIQLAAFLAISVGSYKNLLNILTPKSQFGFIYLGAFALFSGAICMILLAYSFIDEENL